MSQIPHGRVPLTPTRAVSTFGILVVGFMSANLVPLMIVAVESELGVSTTQAGTIATACVLATAISCVLVTRLAERGARHRIARLGLALAAAGFGLAALNPSPVLAVTGIVLGGLGGGGAVAAGGAALAALRNPNRMSAASGLTNRGVVTLVLAIVPLFGIVLASVFGALAILALAMLAVVRWLPSAPASSVAAELPEQVTAATDAPRTGEAPIDPRLVTAAGIGILVIFPLWGLSEDALWAMSGAIGTQQAGMSEAMTGLVLSLSTAGGILGSLALILLGTRLGRALPLGILMVLGAVLKVVATHSEGGVYFWTVIVWNTLYAVIFTYFAASAAALDIRGRWSAPLSGVYLFGSSMAPLFGAVVSDALGYAGLGWVLAAMSAVLILPAVLIALLSSRVERLEAATAARVTTFEEGRLP